MTDPETIARAGKRIAAIAAGRAFREDMPRDTDEADPSAKTGAEHPRREAAQAPAEGSDELPPPTRDSPAKPA